ncbi:hypothetical protein Q5762_07395 [Streptomyces sp. P9(2023)]|uniref:hypothetical protein n=1 Tax=Streptomyces sp. P9(2023) TaxID=3064394 RepID=UPI0028F45409|nr:hypothetical protein [Streptomyces sp. P9(2023)]MDT9688181.1 hypothetical protein [Streptomyces sp. P9(2023)]
MATQGTHFWFMTIQTPTTGGFHIRDFSGTISPSRGRTRFDLFNELRKKVTEVDPKTEHGTVIAFDIQPNKL